MAEDTTRTHEDFVRDNPQAASWFAEQFSQHATPMLGVISEQISTEFATQLGNAVAERQAMTAKIDALAEAKISNMGMKPGDFRYRQLNESLRCKFMDMNNRAFEVDKKLDADGWVTQSLASTVGSAGGFTVPTEFAALVERRNVEPSIVWPLLQKRPTGTDLVKSSEITTYITSNKGSDAKSRSATTSDEVTETVPVFGELTWTLVYFDARVPIKLNLLEDSHTDVVQLAVNLVAEAFLNDHEALPLTGTGQANNPTGILNIASGVTASTLATLTTTTVTDFVATLPQRYRTGQSPLLLIGTKLFFKTALAFAEGIRSAEYLMDMLPPMKESANMPEGKMLIGDFDRYVVYYNPLMRMVSGVRPEKWTEEFVFQERWDGILPIADSFRIGNVTTY